MESGKVTPTIVKILAWVIGLPFVLTGLGILCLSLYLYKDQLDFKKIAVKTEATITFIDYEYGADNNDEAGSHLVFVSFTADGKKYEGQLDFYSSDMEEGGTTTIVYDPKNPNNFRSDGTILYLILIAGGGVFIVMGLSVMGSASLAFRSYKKRVEQMMNDGSYNYETYPEEE